MKKLILPLLIVVLTGFTTIEMKLSDTERKAAVEELIKTNERLLKTVEGLSEAQLNFKGSPDSWSIAECVEHLAISETSFGQMLQGALQTPADASKRAEVKMTDQEIMAIITSREKKVKTAEAFEPSGKFGTYAETLKAFEEKRAAHIDYMKHTEDDLRNHYGQLPLGTIDGLQIVLSMSGHTERHVLQMEEVKAHPDFPKE